MMASASTFVDAARQTAERFLQAVVVVDDQAALGVQLKPPMPPLAQVKETVGRKGKLVPPAVSGLASEEHHELNAKEVVDQFAKLGLVCAVLKPEQGENPELPTVAAARRADIVILDWYLNGIAGDTALDLIDAILRSDAGAQDLGRLRLIVIYTGEAALYDIVEAVRGRISAHYPEAKTRKLDPFTLTRGPVRVSVLAKSGARIPSKNIKLSERRVATTELPHRVITEFSSMNAGIVPNVALESVAALRSNTHKLLARLHAGLDCAYLWHRMMQPFPADAEEHLIELVAEEVRAIFEDSPASTAANLEAITKWLKYHKVKSDYDADFGVTTHVTTADVDRLLTLGATDSTVKSRFPSLKKMPKGPAVKAFAASTVAGENANMEFAALTTLKTQYMKPPPQLTLGTLLARGAGKRRRHYVCMQPRCDSVRLTGKADFPLLPLVAVSGSDDFNLIVPTYAKGSSGRPSAYLRLKIDMRPTKLVMVPFPVTAGRDCVIAESQGRQFRFNATPGHHYKWVGQLKSQHAQRLAEELGTEFSRVGLTEAEWLRKWSR